MHERKAELDSKASQQRAKKYGMSVRLGEIEWGRKHRRIATSLACIADAPFVAGYFFLLKAKCLIQHNKQKLLVDLGSPAVQCHVAHVMDPTLTRIAHSYSGCGIPADWHTI
eukprot:gb/GECG01008897.1/.p1 GENE.gb/GECG01008897.1/~~gb/GECG01008897.1/.p1  ORF type:complete len:112 (+),score=9.09 gb/GECG01008897.1/:1-336(+)